MKDLAGIVILSEGNPVEEFKVNFKRGKIMRVLDIPSKIIRNIILDNKGVFPNSLIWFDLRILELMKEPSVSNFSFKSFVPDGDLITNN